MSNEFALPQGMIGRFGVVKLWPKIKTAEDENIARLKIAAQSLGLECVEIDELGCAIEFPHATVTQADLDFVIHLHYQTPKTYDVFSFVALWNPLQFYHEWGYLECSQNLLTHDDFLSCNSPGADHMIARVISSDSTRMMPEFRLFHSSSAPILEPTLGDRKLFYVGINWERVGKGKGRHQALLDALDGSGDLRIYGPRIFLGVNVWRGFKSYVDELPFDGITSIKEINKAGIVLVLSSEAHKQSGLMSNRLFEAIAGGAVAICDENPFAKKYFGDTVLYVDTTLPNAQVVEQVKSHIAWIKKNPEQAIELVRRAQAIFNEKFRLDISLSKIYSGLQQRRQHLKQLYTPQDTTAQITLYFLLPCYDPNVLQRHIASYKTQAYPACRAVLVCDSCDIEKYGQEIDQSVAKSGLSILIMFQNFYNYNRDKGTRARITRGKILADILCNDNILTQGALYCVVAPNETLFSNHILGLMNVLEAQPKCSYAFSYALQRYRDKDGIKHEVIQDFMLTRTKGKNSSGFSRLLCRYKENDSKLEILLPYLDVLAPQGLANLEEGALFPRSTVIIDIEDPFNIDNEAQFDERDILRDMNWIRFDAVDAKLQAQESSCPISFSLQKLSDKQKREVLIDLWRSIPMPHMMRSVIRVPWRLLLSLYRRYNTEK